MIHMPAGLGSHITTVIAKMKTMAVNHNQPVTTTFNDVKLVVRPDTTEAEALASFNAERARLADAWATSPEGIESARRQEEYRARLQGEMDAAMARLDALDWRDIGAVLGWIEQVQNATDYIGVTTPRDEIVAAFLTHDYFPNVNLGDQCRPDDADNFGRYIIGQALACLMGEVGAIHQVTHKFIGDWRRRFVV